MTRQRLTRYVLARVVRDVTGVEVAEIVSRRDARVPKGRDGSKLTLKKVEHDYDPTTYQTVLYQVEDIGSASDEIIRWLRSR